MKRFDVEKKFGEGNTIGGVFVKNFVKNYSIAHIQIQGCPFDSYLIKGRYQKSNGAARVGEFVLDAISMEKTGSRNASPAAGAPPQALSPWPVRDCIIEKIVVVSTSDVAATTERVKHTQVKDPSAPTVAKPAPPTPPLKAS